MKLVFERNKLERNDVISTSAYTCLCPGPNPENQKKYIYTGYNSTEPGLNLFNGASYPWVLSLNNASSIYLNGTAINIVSQNNLLQTGGHYHVVWNTHGGNSADLYYCDNPNHPFAPGP